MPAIDATSDQPVQPESGLRFAPGQILANRYRIVAALGKGGMGEVYRADDLTLGQSIALKFLPERLLDPSRLARFRQEVASARQVSHTNVCRVYDIIEGDHAPFLTMEYVDGEDLASLLRRIGRLPEDKAIDIARQLCSGLAAVHEEGLLHRDLKPANVMLDGRGKVRLTDFGLAALAGAVDDVRSGTPAYMAPEQLTGKEVTTRSDLFSLGLVLFEIFTGKKPFPAANRDELLKAYESSEPSKPTSHLSTLDPAVERIILKCLGRDPANRPRSVYEVLAGLPGGGPLAAALAAGETPSPKLVADAEVADGQLRPWVALALIAIVVAGVLVTGWLGGLITLAPRTGMRDAEPALMRHKAREVLATLGHDETPGDWAVRYIGNHDYFEHLRNNNPSPDKWDGRWQGLDDGRPPAMLYFYRSARGPLAPTNHHVFRDTPGQVDPVSPPPLEPGMADVTLDFRGRLLMFHKIADFLGPDAAPAVPPMVDWQPAFAAAGLDWKAFAANPVHPRHQPPLAFDARFAWEGPYPDASVDRVRVEAASLGGKPVYFMVEFPWQSGEKASAYPGYLQPDRFRLGDVVFLTVFPLLAVGLAWWNWRAGRGDLIGAGKIAGVLFALWFIRWVLTAHHVADGREERLVESGLGMAVRFSVMVAVFYLALEPIVRKRWPWRLVGWNRLLAGRIRDPLVARDMLIGLAAGSLYTAMVMHQIAGPIWAPELLNPFAHGEFEYDPTRCVVNPLTVGVLVGFAYFFLVFLGHWVCRNFWVASAVIVLIVLALSLNSPNTPKPVSFALTVLVATVGLQFVALRFGLLAFVTAFLPFGWLCLSGWTFDVRAWYATGPNLAIGVLLALTLFAAYFATGGRLLGKGEAGDD